MPDPRHVFISYSRTDTTVMQRVKQSLLDHQLPVWTDEGIAPGTPSWKRAISTAIEQSACLVCLLSPDAKNSEWVQRELDYAEAHSKPVLALLVRGNTTASVPFALIGTQYVDIQQDYERGISRLLPLLTQLCGPLSSADSELTRLPLLDMPADPEATVVSESALIAEAAKPKSLLEHIPTLEAAPVDYSKIKPVTRNRDWMPIIRVINGIEMCLVPPGCFMMGSEEIENAKPVHQRCFEKPFWIGRYPVTNAQYGEAVRAGVCKPPTVMQNQYFNQPKQPVVGVDWYSAQCFAGLMGMRLPTESEWEYAARGPESWVWPWGNEFRGENLICKSNSDRATRIVGVLRDGASWVGVHDMSGNVWEWCLTKWRETYSGPENNDPDGNNDVRVLRGGSWNDSHYLARPAFRNSAKSTHKLNNDGFRLVMVFDLTAKG